MPGIVLNYFTVKKNVFVQMHLETPEYFFFPSRVKRVMLSTQLGFGGETGKGVGIGRGRALPS